VTIADHYEPSDLAGRVAAALQQAGLASGVVRWSDTASFDQFHVRGPAATEELAAALAPSPGATILDVGCGLGGPARYLAAEYGCRVVGVDLSRAFIDVARMLTDRAGLSASVTCEQGDALDLHYGDGAFDHAWTQHVAMNIADRERLYTGIHRVLQPGGRLAIYDIVEGNGRPLAFPVPWARDAADSFLMTGDAMRELLAQTGFTEISWADTTDAGIAWFAELQAARAAGQAGQLLGLQMVMGDGFQQMAANLAANLQSGRVRVIRTVVRRTS
jgi:ubiquinone/menaquinone biosynthesis C-methylase UbiE